MASVKRAAAAVAAILVREGVDYAQSKHVELAMDVRERVGRNLRRYRLLKGISQETLAHQSGVARAYVGRIECGVQNPTVVILEQLAAKLDIPAAALLEIEAEAAAQAE